jgi:hypothetical protein
MSVNRYQPHVFVLPEDDANRQLANGFLLDLSTRQVQVLTEAAGWINVRNRFASDHVFGMRKYDGRLMVLLVDFDDDINRLQDVRAAIPQDLTDRVFVLGVWSEPEALRQAGLGSYETIGKAMAEDCRAGTRSIWAHDLLRHNDTELTRLCRAVFGILFSP